MTGARESDPGWSGATRAILIIGGVLALVGSVVGFVNANAAAAAERAGLYEATLSGGINSFSAVVESHQAWTWIGFGAAILGVLMLVGILFIRAARR